MEMADAHGAGRTRPRGAAKIKLHGSTGQSKVLPTSPQNTVLPKLKSNNNYSEYPTTSRSPYSPRVHEIPIVLPATSAPRRPVVPTLRPAPPTGSDSTHPSLAKTAWSTPRSPGPETSEPSTALSTAEVYSHTEGSALRTSARMLSIEETLLATEQLYLIDWTKLQADADKFLEISAIANQHLDVIQAELPLVASTTEQTKAALTELSNKVETLHHDYNAEKEEILAQGEDALAQHDLEREALVNAHATERKALEETHANELKLLKEEFHLQIRDNKERSAATDAESRQEIESLKQTMARDLHCQVEKSLVEREQLAHRFEDELAELRTRKDAELAELRDTTNAAYQQLLSSSEHEIRELKSTSATEIERLMDVSASSLAEVTEKLSSELAETQEEATRMKDEYVGRIAQLQWDALEELTQLRQRQDEECQTLQAERDNHVSSLQRELESTKTAYTSHVKQLLVRATAEASVVTAMLTGETNALVRHHEQAVKELCTNHTDEVFAMIASHDAELITLKRMHEDELVVVKNDASSTHAAVVQQYESQRCSVEEEIKREKERMVVRYEADLDSLRRSTAEQVETVTAKHTDAIRQLREAHAARVLALETTIRENDKLHADAITHLEEELEEKKTRIVELEAMEETLRLQNTEVAERCNEETSRWAMRLEEVEAAVALLETTMAARGETIESLKRTLRTSEDGNYTKSNTLLELTFVIKSRDDEIQKLHAELLNSIQNVNSKSEILELTTETLSSKSKELEDTQAALRMESGRLSRVEEAVQMKAGMLEDSELKIENMRLQTETLRLEMKRLQMDMRLQHVHSAGEIELKQGEIRRLHVAQKELKQKNEIHLETIMRLEGSLAAAERQGDELRRRTELLKLETALAIEDARKLEDELLEKEKQVVVLTKEAQTLHNDKLKLQIQLNNSLTRLQTQREKLEQSKMLVEDLHGQYRRRLEMTAAEKNSGLRHDQQSLLMELCTLKAKLREYGDMEGQLDDWHDVNDPRQARMDEVAEMKVELEMRIKVLEQEVARLEAEKISTVEELTGQLQQLEMQLEERRQRVRELELEVEGTRQELNVRNALVTSVASDSSSWSHLIQEKDDTIATMQQRLDGALHEKLLVSEEATLLRDQLVKAKTYHREVELRLQDGEDAEEKLFAIEEKHSKAMTELETVLVKERSEKTIQGQAHQEANLQIQYLVTVLKAAEDSLAVHTHQLKKEQSEKALQGQAHQEANLQIQYLVTTLKLQEEALAAVMKQLHDASMSLKETEREADEKVAVAAAEAVQIQRLEVEALKQELAGLVASHAAQLQQLEDVKKQEANQLREELKESFRKKMTALRADHAGVSAAADDAARAQLNDAESRLMTAVTQAEEATKNWGDARSQCQELTQHVEELQQQLVEARRSLAETQEIVRVRKATIDSVRKELAVVMEIQKQATATSDASGGGSSGSVGGSSMERALQLVQHQLETFATEEFHMEAAIVKIATEEDLLIQLQDGMRMRCCLSAIGSPHVLTTEDVCRSLHTLQQIARIAIGVSDLSPTTLSTIEEAVAVSYHAHAALVQQLQSLLDVGETVVVADALQAYSPVFNLLKELPVSEESASVHATRAAALLAIVADHKAVHASADLLLIKSRDAFQTDALLCLEDLLPVVNEAASIRRHVHAPCDGIFSSEEEQPSEPTTNFLLTSELQRLLNERHHLLTELSSILTWRKYESTPPPLTQSTHIVETVRELMRIFDAFESVTSSRRQDESTESSLAERAQAVVAFVEELRSITQFAHSILDEKNDVTAVGAADRSLASSFSSLLSLRGGQTRTPTPTTNLQVEITPSASATSLVHIESTMHESFPEGLPNRDLLLAAEPLTPTATTDPLCPNLVDALSASLMDIALVMNDHHRLLYEAAPWIGKARFTSPREDVIGGSMDVATELTQLVRDHCALLSLARKLFGLHNPRQELAAVLECLAVLSRLNGRLGFFDASIHASDSSASLPDSEIEVAQLHEKLQAPRSVFVSMEEIARHLQDYDGFVGRLLQTHFSGEGIVGSIDNIETLSSAVEERLTVVGQLCESLGLTIVGQDLLSFVETLQKLVTLSIAEEEDDEEQHTSLSVDRVVKTIEKAFQDRTRLRELLVQMQETLPILSSADSPEKLMDLCREMLKQHDSLIKDKETAWSKVDNLTQQLAEEDSVLKELDEEEDLVNRTRIERLTALVNQLKTLRRENETMTTSIATETALLYDASPLAQASGCEVSIQSNDACVEGVEGVEDVQALIKVIAALTLENEGLLTQLQGTKSEDDAKSRDLENLLLKTNLEDAETQLSLERQQRDDDMAEEKQFLSALGIDWAENDSRLTMYDRLLSKHDESAQRDQRLRDEWIEETAFLIAHGMAVATDEDEVHSSRMAIFKTLFDEKTNRERSDLHAFARLEADGIEVSDREKGLDAIVTRLIDVTNQAKQHDEGCAQERTFLNTHGITDAELSSSDSRIAIYKTLLERIQAAKESLEVWEGSPHGDAHGCQQADAARETDHESLKQDYDEATAKAVAAALAQQAKQFDFRLAVLAVADAASTLSPSSRTTLEAFTKRDNTAITMIYRLIRLTTEVLHTSAFSLSKAGGGGNEIPVDLTQSVMTCVKELKALKEYLLQTLEQIGFDSGAFAIAQPRLAITRESLTDRDAAIDFALLLHREFVVDVHKTLEANCKLVTTKVHTLRESLATYAGNFSEAQINIMTMEMEMAREVAQRATLEAKSLTQDAFLETFVADRKRIETVLTHALDDATQERTELLAKMEILHAEKSEAFALMYANGITLTTSASSMSTPRPPPLINGRGVSATGVHLPTRPEKPRELSSSRLKTGPTSTAHKERFVSDMETETGQRRTPNPHAGMTARRANEWKRHELLTSSTQIEQQFRAMNDEALIAPDSPKPRDRLLADQELWYQGVRLMQHASFFVSVYFVPKQKTFRVEVFNSDSEQQQTIYVTRDDMQRFLHENTRAVASGLTLDDRTRRSEIADVLFQRIKVLGGGIGGDGESTNILFAFQ